MMPVLFTLSATPTLTQKQLALSIDIEQPTMSATLARMERDQLISRTPDPSDRRKSLITLTPLAESKLQHVFTTVSYVNTSAMQGLSEEERLHLQSLLSRVVTNLRSG